MDIKEELKKTMEWLAEQPDSIFVGQNIVYPENQIVNHLDKLRYLYRDSDKAKVVIRTAVGGTKPLDAGPQHTKNHTEAFRLMCPSINVVEITKPEDILPTYQEAYGATDSYLIVENWNDN